MNNRVWLEASQDSPLGIEMLVLEDGRLGCAGILESRIRLQTDLPGLEITGAVPGGLQMPSGSFWEHQELQPLCHCSSVLALCLMTSFELGECSQDSSKSLVWAVIPGE